MPTNPSIEILPLIFGLLGGLALFLYGIEQMTGALKTAAGSKIKNLLARMTSNRIKGALTGAFATAVVQSSSVTTVLVVGFISAGLLSLNQAISIIVGANVGSTLTVQIIAFNVTQYSLIMIALGFALKFFSKKDKFKYLGVMLMGFGLIFLGMQFMSDATRPLRAYEPFVYAMSHMKNPLIGILIAAAFTAIIQSSAAAIGIVITLASQGFINLEAGISFIHDTEFGTTDFSASMYNIPIFAVFSMKVTPNIRLNAGTGMYLLFNSGNLFDDALESNQISIGAHAGVSYLYPISSSVSIGGELLYSYFSKLQDQTVALQFLLVYDLFRY